MSKSKVDTFHTFRLPDSPTSCLTNIQNLTVRSLVDTGSELSLLNQRVLDGLKNKPILQKGGVSLHSANGSNMDVTGKVLLNFKLHGLKFEHEFIVVKDLSRNAILGRDFLGKHGASVGKCCLRC